MPAESSSPVVPLFKSQPLIRAPGLERRHRMGSEIIHALRGVDLTMDINEYAGNMGPSGSGKSTRMKVIGCLQHRKPDTVRRHSFFIGPA